VSLKIVKNYVNGQWREAENTGYIDVENPSTGEILKKYEDIVGD
jgi:acyl-CoA reductase-like NAD-dependent aldehyde dehydrogenase